MGAAQCVTPSSEAQEDSPARGLRLHCSLVDVLGLARDLQKTGEFTFGNSSDAYTYSVHEMVKADVIEITLSKLRQEGDTNGESKLGFQRIFDVVQPAAERFRQSRFLRRQKSSATGLTKNQDAEFCKEGHSLMLLLVMNCCCVVYYAQFTKAPRGRNPENCEINK